MWVWKLSTGAGTPPNHWRPKHPTAPKPHWPLPTLCGLKVNHGSLWLPTSKLCISSFSGLRLCFSKCVLWSPKELWRYLRGSRGGWSSDTLGYINIWHMPQKRKSVSWRQDCLSSSFLEWAEAHLLKLLLSEVCSTQAPAGVCVCVCVCVYVRTCACMHSAQPWLTGVHSPVHLSVPCAFSSLSDLSPSFPKDLCMLSPQSTP